LLAVPLTQVKYINIQGVPKVMSPTLRLIAQPLLMVETPYFQNNMVYALIRGFRWKNCKIPIILRPRPKHFISYNCLCSRDIDSNLHWNEELVNVYWSWSNLKLKWLSYSAFSIYRQQNWLGCHVIPLSNQPPNLVLMCDHV